VRKRFLIAMLTAAISMAIVGCEKKEEAAAAPADGATAPSAADQKGAGQNAAASGMEPGPGNEIADQRVGSGLKGK